VAVEWLVQVLRELRQYPEARFWGVLFILWLAALLSFAWIGIL
jgi:hypothetical protein